MMKVTQLEVEKTQLESTLSKQASLNLSRFQDYTIERELPAQGAESDIYVIEKENKKYILKLYRLGFKPKKDIFNKLEKLSKKYPNNFIKIYKIGFDDTSSRWYEIQEYIANGSLKEYKNRITTEILYKIIAEILEIFNLLHANKIVHRDIKPENILIRSYQPLNLVITDFGISSLLNDSTNIWTNRQGTHRYFAPESFAGVLGIAVDYWSMGMIIYELANGGKHYFDGINDENTIQRHIFTKEIAIPSFFDENIQQLLHFLFRRNPENRANYKLVKKWLNGEDIGTPKSDETLLEKENGYPFEGNKFNDFYALATKVSKNYKNWKLWGEHLKSKNPLKWADKYQQYDKSILLKNCSDDNIDLMVLKFIYTFNGDMKEFILFGKVLNLNNLYLFVQNNLQGNASIEEKEIYRLLISGKLIDFYNSYLEFSETLDTLSWVLKEISEYINKRGEDGISKRIIFNFLEFSNEKENYLLPAEEDKVSIQNFHLFIKKSDLNKSKLNIFFLENLENITLLESKNLKKLISLNLKEYYYPNDFFINLEKDFSNTIKEIDFFIKKSTIDDITKRYYIPINSDYEDCITKLKESSSTIYLSNYKLLKSLKKEKLLLKTQLESIQEDKKFFDLLNINVTHPLPHHFEKIKKVLNSNMDFKEYVMIQKINKNRIDKDFNVYINKMESFNIKLLSEDKKIIKFIKNYRWQLQAIRFLYIVLSLLIFVASYFHTAYLFSFLIGFSFITLSYILLVGYRVSVSHAFIKRIEEVINVKYKNQKDLPNRLIILDNILVRFVIWSSITLLSIWIIYSVIFPLIVTFLQWIESIFSFERNQ